MGYDPRCEPSRPAGHRHDAQPLRISSVAGGKQAVRNAFPAGCQQPGDELNEQPPERLRIVQPVGDDAAGDVGVDGTPVRLFARRGALDDEAAPVGGIALPRHVAGALEPVRTRLIVCPCSSLRMRGRAGDL